MLFVLIYVAKKTCETFAFIVANIGCSCFWSATKWFSELRQLPWFFRNNCNWLTQSKNWCCPWQQDLQYWTRWLLWSFPLSANVTSGSIKSWINCKLSKKLTSLTRIFSSWSTNNYAHWWIEAFCIAVFPSL